MRLEDLELDISACPICSSKEFVSLARIDRHQLGIQTVGCNKCGLIQTNPRPSELALNNFYKNYYREFYQGVKIPSEDYVTQLKKSERLLYTAKRIIRKCSLKENSVILDYGCGEGSLFVALKQTDFGGVKLGVEPNKEFAQYASEKGDAIVYDDLNKVTQKVDCVVVNHVLEHMPNPVDFLKKLSKTINTNGLIYIDVPNVNFYSSPNDLHIAHLFHFNETTLKFIAEKAEYTVVSCEEHNPPYHPKSLTIVLAKSSVNSNIFTNIEFLDSDKSSWDLIKKIQDRSWKFSFIMYLKKKPHIVKVYKMLKKIIKSNNV